MQTYRSLKARMKGQTPPNWSPALRPVNGDDLGKPTRYGDGLIEIDSNVLEDNYERSQPVNQTIYQAYEWYTPSWSTPITVPEPIATSDVIHPSSTTATTTKTASQPLTLPSHYSVIKALISNLADLGITSMWLPPGCKSSNPQDNGYGIHDLYDLGDFDNKGSRATKWGSKEELVELGKMAEEVGIGLLWDAVLNHRAAADRKEKAKAIEVNRRDRTIENFQPKDVVTWTCFDYAARQGKHSTMTYNWRHFTAVDWDDQTRSNNILKFVGDDTTTKPGFATDVDDELGNYDYLMFADVDYSQLDVQEDVLNWVTWLPTQVPGLTGFRLDAIKHYSASFQYRLLKHLRDNPATKDYFVVGEYWKAESKFLAKHIEEFAGHMHLFDVKLMYNLADLSNGILKDLRRVFEGSLVKLKPKHAVTFATNHDTQTGQSLSSPISPWFLPHAYALILLRRDGQPCIFHGDIFGTLGPDPTPPASGNRMMRLSLIRNLYAYGPQHEFFHSRSLIGWSREGHRSHSNGAGIAVVLNTSWKWRILEVFVGVRHKGETWTDLMGWSWDDVVIDREGWGRFRVPARSVGVFADKRAVGRDRVDGLIWPPLMGKGTGGSESTSGNATDEE